MNHDLPADSDVRKPPDVSLFDLGSTSKPPFPVAGSPYGDHEGPVAQLDPRDGGFAAWKVLSGAILVQALLLSNAHCAADGGFRLFLGLTFLFQASP